MKTYWDLPESERAALTRDGVARYIDAELMLKGVLAVVPLELVDVPEVELAKATVWRIGPVGYGSIDIAFATEDAARRCLDLGPMRIDSDWVTAAVSELREAKAANEENARRTERHVAQVKIVDDTLNGLWDDWQECRSKAARMAIIVGTFDKYLGLADGNAEVASKFLRTTFPSVDELVAAEEWTGRKLLVNSPANDVAQTAEPAPAPVEF